MSEERLKRSQENILSLINSFEEKPSLKEFCSEKSISSSTIYNYFDSWNDALKKSKFKSINQKSIYSKDEILIEIKNIFQKENKNTLTYRDFEKESEISAETVINKFGSWNGALKEAEIELVNRKNISKDELLDELKRLSENHCPKKDGIKHKTVQKYGNFSLSSFRNIFGSLDEALQEANIPETDGKHVETSFLLSDILRVSEKYCSSERPSIDDIDRHGSYSPPTYIEKFGSWNEAVEKAGFERYKHPIGEENPSWKGGYGDYYGPSWRNQRRKALERDDCQCLVCGKSQSKNKTTPDVHHIKPRRKWNVEEEHEQMNHLRNLICLCPRHHRNLEGRWQDLSYEEFLDKIEEEYNHE